MHLNIGTHGATIRTVQKQEKRKQLTFNCAIASNFHVEGWTRVNIDSRHGAAIQNGPWWLFMDKSEAIQTMRYIDHIGTCFECKYSFI